MVSSMRFTHMDSIGMTTQVAKSIKKAMELLHMGAIRLDPTSVVNRTC